MFLHRCQLLYPFELETLEVVSISDALLSILGVDWLQLAHNVLLLIVGVMIGVLVTRPAYGDILRSFVLDE